MVLKNFIATLRRFKLASGLNILGLSVAFAAFILILIQITYEYGYGKDDPNYKRIFRVEVFNSFDNLYSTNNSFYGRKEDAFLSIPNVEGCAQFLYQSSEVIVDLQGDEVSFPSTSLLAVFNDISQVFEIDMIQGEFASALEPGKTLISQSYARRLFGKEDPVGKQIRFRRNNYTVSGVYRDFPDNAILQGNLICLGNGSVKTVFLKLNDPARTEDVIELLPQEPESFWGHVNYRLNPVGETYFSGDMQENMFIKSGNRQTTHLFTAVAILILLIAAINFVNFSTALVPVRIKALNTRMVLGESMGALRRAMLFEAIGITLIAFGISLLIVILINATALVDLLKAGDTTLGGNAALIGWTALIALATGVAAGLYPAFYATSFKPAMVLKGAFGLNPQGKRLRTMLVGIQFTVSIALIVFAFFIAEQNRFFRTAPVGYNKDNVITLNLYQSGFDSKTDVIRQELERLPGVEGTALSGSFGTWERDLYGNLVFGSDTVKFKQYLVDLDFLDVMQIPILEGRGFRKGDWVDPLYYEEMETFPTLPIVINFESAQRYNLKVDTVLNNGTRQYHVIGISGNVISRSMHKATEDIAFWPVTDNHHAYMFIRIAPDNQTETIGRIRQVLESQASDSRWSMNFFTENLEQLYEKERDLGLLISLFSLLAVIISLVGVFGLVVFETQYRTKEIGIRKINGATTGEILGLFNRSFVRIVAVCFVIATPIAYYFVKQWLGGFAYRTPMYWWIFVLALAVVLLITLVTVTLQSWRTANENPVKAIKQE